MSLSYDEARDDIRTKTLIAHSIAGNPTTKQLVAGLFEVNGYDGLKANYHWQVMNQGAEMGRGLAWGKYAYLGIFGLSACHCANYASLSKTGKLLAPVGAAAGLFFFASSFTVTAKMRRNIAPPEEPAAAE